MEADNPDVGIVHRGKARQLSQAERKQLKRRQAIEPIIGHLKSDHGMDRCHLKGRAGDAMHAVLCAAGYNIRWLLRMIAKKGITFLRQLYLRLCELASRPPSWAQMLRMAAVMTPNRPAWAQASG